MLSYIWILVIFLLFWLFLSTYLNLFSLLLPFLLLLFHFFLKFFLAIVFILESKPAILIYLFKIVLEILQSLKKRAFKMYSINCLF